MRKISAFLLVFVLIFSLFGCDNSKSPYVPTGNGLQQDITTKPVTPPAAQKDLILAYFEDQTLNPFDCVDYVNRSFVDLLYQGLFTVDAAYTVKPMLCKSYTISSDMRSYTFYLEKATFSDGSALTAADVVASLQYAAQSAFYSGRFSYLKSVSATEDGAVQVQLSTPYENFPLLLDVPIVKASQVSAPRPIGTGPFFFETFEGQTWLRRCPNWWCEATLPISTDYIALQSAGSPSQMRDSFELSDLSMVVADSGNIHYADFHISSEELWSYESGIFLYLACNEESEVFSNTAVRQALTSAINRTGLCNQFYRGYATATVLPISPNSPLYQSGMASKVTYDPSKLTNALNAAGLQETPVVLLVNSGDVIRVRVARSIVNALRECGLKITTSELQNEEYRTALQKGEFDLHLGQTKLSANGDLSAFFAPKGALSHGGLSDPAKYSLCTDALANAGNYFTLYQQILADGQLCPLLIRSYAVYSKRGVMSSLMPSRDHVFYYDLGKTMEQALLPENN